MTAPARVSVRARYDAVVVGAGPNGLAAAIALAEAGRLVLVVEGHSTVGGGCRTAELTLPGFRHDVCSAVHPMGRASPFFRRLPLRRHGLDWIDPPVALGHPLDDGRVALLRRSVAETAATLGQDGRAYSALFGPLARDADQLLEQFLGPLRIPLRPAVLGKVARFGLPAVLPAVAFARLAFRDAPARALIAGMAAHALLDLREPMTASFALVFGLVGHAYGWPVARGGSQAIADALAAHLRSMGGEIVTDWWVRDLRELPPHRAALLDLVPNGVLGVAGAALPAGYRRRLEGYRYGPGVFKLDLALDGPIPWRSPELLEAGTVHLGGTLEEIARSERLVASGHVPERPFVLLAQQSLFDPLRAPAGAHTVWAYCHVPNGSPVDMTERILRQIERFAPGVRDRILATRTASPAEIEAYDPNVVGGDIGGGRQDIRQLWTRPVARLDPYSTPNPSLFICSSATPPGAGVHGMAGWWAAQSALRGVLR